MEKTPTNTLLKRTFVLFLGKNHSFYMPVIALFGEQIVSAVHPWIWWDSAVYHRVRKIHQDASAPIQDKVKARTNFPGLNQPDPLRL